MPLILIGGAARSGKSSYALELARERGVRRAFLATAEVHDEEMAARVSRHQAERDSTFHTVEEPVRLYDALVPLEDQIDVVVVDCLTLWLSNVMHREPAFPMEEELNHLASLPYLVILVTNEVGAGIVPMNELARAFRDRAGLLNQHAARVAEEVYLVAFGLPLRLK